MNIVDPSAHTLVAGDLAAVFLPSHGMLGASLRYQGVEILRRVEDLAAAAARGSSAGMEIRPARTGRQGEWIRDAEEGCPSSFLIAPPKST